MFFHDFFIDFLMATIFEQIPGQMGAYFRQRTIVILVYTFASTVIEVTPLPPTL